MMKIQKIVGREILDSRGNPTVEVDVVLEKWCNGTCCCAFWCKYWRERGS